MRPSDSRRVAQPASDAVRPFRQEDLPAVERFFAATGVFNPEEMVCLNDDMSFFLDGRYPDDEVLVYIDDSGAPRGLIHYGPLPISTGGFGLHWIGVDPDCQTKGVGSVLIEAMERAVRRLDGRIIFIETSSRDDYRKTRSFYLKHGYRLAAQIADYYAPKDDKCIFSKILKEM